MAVKFATPIAHEPIVAGQRADYGRFTAALAAGREYRQPLETVLADRNAVADGLEIFIEGSAPADLYASFDGTLEWEAASRSRPDQLVLTVSREVLQPVEGNAPTTFASLPLLEGPPGRLVYENVDRQAVQDALKTLLSEAYDDATKRPRQPKTWHPAMSVRRPRRGRRRGPLMRVYLRDFGDDRAAEISRVVGDFVAGSPRGALPTIPVRAGDRIGQAALYRQGDVLPQVAPFTLGDAQAAGSARRLLWRTFDTSGFPINPLYYLHVCLRQALVPDETRVIDPVTSVVADGLLTHPLVALYQQVLGDTAPPRGRERVNGRTVIPLGPLASFHGLPAPYRTPPDEPPKSEFEWRYTDTGAFEAQEKNKPNSVVALAKNDGETKAAKTKVTTTWERYGASIARVAEAFQVPCETIVAIIGVESLPDLSPRVVRIEPLWHPHRKDVRSDAAAKELETAYHKAAGYRGTVKNLKQTKDDNDKPVLSFTLDIDEGVAWRTNALKASQRTVLWGSERLDVLTNSAVEGKPKSHSLTTACPRDLTQIEQTEAWVLDGWAPKSGIPDGTSGSWPGTELVHRESDSTLTWDELVTVVRATKGDTVSPGLTQTLISTALKTLAWIAAVKPDIYDDDELDIERLAPRADGTWDAGELLNDWLLNPVHAIVAGAAYMRMCYNRAATGFDLPLVASAFNANKHAWEKGTPKGNGGSEWGMVYHGGYVQRAGRHNNAVIANVFDGVPAPAVAPTVRFMR
jgi:hypothetical protein